MNLKPMHQKNTVTTFFLDNKFFATRVSINRIGHSQNRDNLDNLSDSIENLRDNAVKKDLLN